MWLTCWTGQSSSVMFGPGRQQRRLATDFSRPGLKPGFRKAKLHMSSRLHAFESSTYYVTYGPHEPAVRISPGDSVRAKTLDAGGLDENGERPPAEMFQQDPDTELSFANPQTGPVYVEGAEPGDMLAVHIDEIELTLSPIHN